MAESLDISVVIPLLNEEESLPELHNWIGKVMEQKGFQYEVLFVDDGSTDKSWNIISELAERDSHVKGIKFNRNYGKSAALNTGFKNVSGRVVITMDADLQDSPDEIPGLYDQIMNEGYDLVSGWKKKRYDPIMKTIPSKFFNFVARKFSGIKLHDFNCGLKAYKKEVVKSIDVYGEMHRYIPFLAKGQGFAKIGERVVQHQARKYGETKFGLERFIFGFLDLLSISFVSKFKKRPMHFFGSFGTLSFFFGTIITFWVIGRKIYEVQMGLPARDVVDQPLFFLALVAVIIGVQLFLAGFIGEMMTQSSTRKNDYLVSKKIGLRD
ncbi:Glycosyltransferase involved in cell wall bisynthesis [Reichenbachiella faecimaris]|uniref:Glycosyltransferase involved in cell wall bisynthesis n=1 Tax=Reichenbachiella faecimaris TaxID=692418 RepID=A0A1W2GAC4_REIFA|nr:glycosyltransferase family 2 protein [Reichenbachiella faecimaris]SMD33246.1 Glycosyltransferase involved in cell wall bisynthesis [Reichenbachiella faecimaris]